MSDTRSASPGPMSPISINIEQPNHKGNAGKSPPSKGGLCGFSFLAAVAIVSLVLGAVSVGQVITLKDRIDKLEAHEHEAHTHQSPSGAQTPGTPLGGMLVTASAVAPAGYTLHGSLSQVGSGEWSPEPHLITERSDHQAVLCAGSIFLLGGLNSSKDVVTDVTKFDPVQETYTHTSSPMPTGRYRFGAACLGGKIYVAGGYSSSTAGEAGECVNTVDIYDVATDSWSAGPPLAIKRGDLALAAVGGKLFAMGGYGFQYPDPDPANDANEELDLARGTWRAVASLPDGGRGDIMAGVINGKVYIAGGWQGVFLDTLIAYTPATDTWATLAKMSAPRGDKSIAVLDGHLYVVGGETWSGKREPCSWDPSTMCDINKVPVHGSEKYYPEHDRWVSVSPMPEARFRSAAAAANGAIHTFGGQAHGEVAVNTAWSFRYVHAPEVYFHTKA